MKDLLEHLKNYWKVYAVLVVLTALVYALAYWISSWGPGPGQHSSGLAWSLLVDGVLLILIILLQRGRGGGLVGALGGMGGQSAFGTKAGDAFTGITIVLSVIWVLLAGFGGIALRAEREKRRFEKPSLRILPVACRESDGQDRYLQVPIRLDRAVDDEVEVSFTIGKAADTAKRNTHYKLTSKIGEGIVISEAKRPDGTIDDALIDVESLSDVKYKDYIFEKFTMKFPAGQTRRVVRLLVVGDDQPNADRAVTLTLEGPRNAVLVSAQSTAEALIRDDDGPLIETGSTSELGPGPAEKKAGSGTDGK